MPKLHPVTRACIAILDNQVARTTAALKGLREDVFTAEPGGRTRSIVEIGRHLLSLRRMQARILDAPLPRRAMKANSASSVAALRQTLREAARLLKQAMLEYDPVNWCCKPSRRRRGVWGDRPTIVRLTRVLNDFTSHLGDIRTIRSILGNPVGR